MLVVYEEEQIFAFLLSVTLEVVRTALEKRMPTLTKSENDRVSVQFYHRHEEKKERSNKIVDGTYRKVVLKTRRVLHLSGFGELVGKSELSALKTLLGCIDCYSDTFLGC